MNPHKLSGIGVLVLVGAIMLLARLIAGCVPQEARSAAAEAGYTGELQACVAKYDTSMEQDACADGVRMRWGTYETVTKRRDGGR